MPVSTDTFRKQRTLHIIFAGMAIALLGSTLWLIMADYTRQWRDYQRDGRLWQRAMIKDASDQALDAHRQREIRQLERQVDELVAAQPIEQINLIGARLEENKQKRAKLILPAAAVKGEIGPKTQQLERARLIGSKSVNEIRQQLDPLKEDYRLKEDEIVQLDQDISEDEQQLRELHSQQDRTEKQIADLMRAKNTAEEKLAKLDPQGVAKLSDKMRNAPLLDWFNPSEKVNQLVVPEIRTDLNFLTVETIDRCNSCHVNIDQPAFEENNLLLFSERQLASYEGQDIDSIDHPVVMLAFWESATAMAGLSGQLEDLQAQTLEGINHVRSSSGLDGLGGVDDLAQEMDRIAKYEPGNSEVTRNQWYRPIGRYLVEIKKLLVSSLGQDQFHQLRDLYRHRLVERYNAFRQDSNLPELSRNPVLLGHPRMDLFVETDSSHPATIMGCTSCHEGSGQETDFHNVAHSPDDVWVDAQTGAVIPEFLLDWSGEEDHEEGGASHLVSSASFSGLSLDGASVVMATTVHDTGGETDGHKADSPHHAKGHSAVRYSHSDLKLTDPTDPAPFAPEVASHAAMVGYHDPAASGSAPMRMAIPKTQYWAQNYGWHAVHYTHWEKPMHKGRFIQSSCNKCHTEIFDIDQAAPKLFEGRLLFSQFGCASCHAIDSLKDDLDIKRAGPSLVHVKQKLSSSMIASWIWSPKGFRPTTKMPHYFMLENNSSPVDILRTRTEVAAITHYLTTAKIAKTTNAYEPELQPEGMTGDPITGRKLFNRVGCLACHSNLDEHGKRWIVEDLVDRKHVSDAEARQQYEQMSYNQRHWYAMEHLPQKLELTGPELSAVGTKLKAGRDDQQANQWLYDWLRHPQHYSDYSIMPSFRLSQQETADLATYLLTLERPEYVPTDFLDLDENSLRMLSELVAQLKSASSTVDMAREDVTKMSTDAKLAFLGEKMIRHYGCNGCHLINGFETASSTCANLDDWGMKDPHKLDFGYFDHAFDHARQKPIQVWKVDHEGLGADAPQVAGGHAKIRNVTLTWEHFSALERRPWLYHKLHNPRVYDRGRTAFEGYLGEAGGFDVKDSSVGQPYNKLKMPKFFMTDQQAQALVTFVTSIRKPLVTTSIQHQAVDEAKMRLIRGRQVATRFNCFGCHRIEDNTPQVWEYFGVFNDDGSFNYEHLNNAPPRLIGQASKTQPQWLHGFLQNVHKLRPWLKIRMPSFSLSSDQATALVDYFVGASQQMSRHMARPLAAIKKYRDDRPNDNRWYASSSLAQPVAHIKALALMADLVRPKDLDPYEADETELAATWAKLVEQVRFMQQMNGVPYPYTSVPKPQVDAEWFARGEAMFKELSCNKCHALGDEEKLLALWHLDNPDAEAEALSSQDAEDEEEGYEEEGYEEEGYGDDDDEGYGDDDEGYGIDEEPAELVIGPVYSAPNLSYTASRLNWDWVDRWLQEPAVIQPGTKMPRWFGGGHTAFVNYPAAIKKQKHSLFGYTGKDQRNLLLDFIYEAGRRGYTPGHERLMGIEPPQVSLPPLPEPEIKQTEQASSDTGGPQSADGAPETQAEPVAAVVIKRPEPQQAKVSTIELHDEPVITITGQGNGRVVGVVRFDGKPARRRPIRMGADAYCAKSNKGHKVLNESMIVNKDKSMQNVFIYVKSGLSGNFATSKEVAVINQTGCRYSPHVVGVMAGQPLVIINSDSTLHNVKMNSRKNGSFNEGMPVPGMQLNKVLRKPEVAIPLKCDVHPWMGAFVHVVEHPYFSVSDVQGRFEITGLPPGTYTFEAVHESKKIASVTFDVTVDADTSNRMDITLR